MNKISSYLRSLLLIELGAGLWLTLKYLFFYWAEYYFKNQLELSTESSRWSTSLLILAMGAGMFLGGWLSPFPASVPFLGAPGWWWLFAKVFFFASAFIWFRASFPRYRYDQIMRLGWKVFIPISIVWIFVVAIGAYYHVIGGGTVA